MVSGELPCSREEAATLAGIQQHLDETWPDDTTEDLPQTDDDEEKDRLIRVSSIASEMDLCVGTKFSSLDCSSVNWYASTCLNEEEQPLCRCDKLQKSLLGLFRETRMTRKQNGRTSASTTGRRSSRAAGVEEN